MSYTTLEALEAHVFARAAQKRVVAVAEAAEEHALEAVRDAMKTGLLSPLLYGSAGKVAKKLSSIGENPQDYEIINTSSPEESAFQAGIAAKEGRVDFILKGLIPTGILLKNLFREEAGFRAGRLISHMNIVQIPTYHKLLALCDAAINIRPNLEQKRDILVNAVTTLTRMGIANPKVAVLASAETVNEKMPETLDAAALKKMHQDGEIASCIVEGPISYDLGVCREAADIKGYDSPVAGDADLLVCPDIVSANVLIKCLRHSANALTAGIVVGGRVPVVLNSRAASAADKYRTMVLAASATL
jgi:phosphate butyryltransferase